jgi:phosphatidylinositol glycan class V
MQSRIFLPNHPIRTLVLSFLTWKTLLLIIAAISPGPGYDTSASLIEPSHGSSQKIDGELPAALRYLVERLTRWDAIYFVQTANRGYLFEQEWAFGWGFSRLIALCTSGEDQISHRFLDHRTDKLKEIGKLGVPHYEGLEALVGVVITHVAHLLSVLVVFALGITLFPSRPSQFALTAAFLHIISPAGLFLSAPYAESSCALLTFSGVLLFAKSFSSNGQPTAGHDLLVLLSGISFGISATFRSNGVLNGLLLLGEAFRVLNSLRYGFRFTTIRRLLATGLGGLSVGGGFLLPQYIAWSEYCGQANADVNSLRPWCQETIPSIYSFVQAHYWYVF